MRKATLMLHRDALLLSAPLLYNVLRSSLAIDSCSLTDAAAAAKTCVEHLGAVADALREAQMGERISKQELEEVSMSLCNTSGRDFCEF